MHSPLLQLFLLLGPSRLKYLLLNTYEVLWNLKPGNRILKRERGWKGKKKVSNKVIGSKNKVKKKCIFIKIQKSIEGFHRKLLVTQTDHHSD